MSLIAYVARRIILLIPVLWGVVTLTFFVSHVIPGDAAQLIAGPRATAELIARIRTEYGLDQPLYAQYYQYMLNLLRGDLGTSILTRRPVLHDILQYFPATFELTTAAILVSALTGVTLGVVAAIKKDTWVDHASRVISIVGVSMPMFWMALLMMVLFYVKLGWFPGAGRIGGEPPLRVTGLYVLDGLLTGNWEALGDAISHLVLPVTALSYAVLSRIVRMTRASMLEVLNQDFVQTARAKGLAERTTLFKHALRNALIPVLTVIGLSYGMLLGGALATEIIFAWPGMAHYAVGSVTSLDYPAVMGVVLVIAVLYTVVNMIVDVTYGLIDPRIRY